MALNSKMSSYTLDRADQQRLLEQATEENNQLRQQLATYQQYEQLSREIRKEVRVIAPQVQSLMLSYSLQVSTDTLPSRRYVTAIVGTQRAMPETLREQLRQWLKARSHADSLRLIVTR
jgi:acetylornithine/succinyldiaminopimelate/putrescine aminotransferase